MKQTQFMIRENQRITSDIDKEIKDLINVGVFLIDSGLSNQEEIDELDGLIRQLRHQKKCFSS